MVQSAMGKVPIHWAVAVPRGDRSGGVGGGGWGTAPKGVRHLTAPKGVRHQMAWLLFEPFRPEIGIGFRC